ncbi:hypothetical protein ACFE04_005119 [Oxalis oulophora]
MEKADVDMVNLEQQPKETNNENNTLVTPNCGLRRKPIIAEEYGEGLPYAPINWPDPGDNWGWKVGRRIAAQGHYLDRYLYPPKRFCKSSSEVRKNRPRLPSKLAVVRFIEEKFPSADTESFFASFTWKIPAPTGNIEGSNLAPPEQTTEVSRPDSPSESDGVMCKAGNKTCISLVTKPEDQNLSAMPMPCDICCSEPRFCRDCCCILCCKTINTDYGGYSYFKCEATVKGDQICGHVAHLNCALRCLMAGTVGGNINLDAEYFCRRCDSKVDLISHVRRLLQICESVGSREDIEKILNVGVCILRGSKKTSAKRLLNRIECSIIKLKCGTSLEDIWHQGEDVVEKFTGVINDTSDEMEVTDHLDSTYDESRLLPDVNEISDYWDEYQKLDYDNDHALRALRKSQDAEYKIAEERITSQKIYLKNLLQELDTERTELASCIPKTNLDILMNTVLHREEQVKREMTRLKEMGKIANGFGKMPRSVLKQLFGIDIDD